MTEEKRTAPEPTERYIAGLSVDKDGKVLYSLFMVTEHEGQRLGSPMWVSNPNKPLTEEQMLHLHLQISRVLGLECAPHD